MTEEERIFRGELFASEEPELVEKKQRAHRLSQKYNETFEDDAEACVCWGRCAFTTAATPGWETIAS